MPIVLTAYLARREGATRRSGSIVDPPPPHAPTLMLPNQWQFSHTLPQTNLRAEESYLVLVDTIRLDTRAQAYNFTRHHLFLRLFLYSCFRASLGTTAPIFSDAFAFHIRRLVSSLPVMTNLFSRTHFSVCTGNGGVNGDDKQKLRTMCNMTKHSTLHYVYY